MQPPSGGGEFRRFRVREFSRPATPMRIRVWRRVAVAATTPTPTRGSTPGLFCSNEGIQLQLSGRQLAVLFEIQNPARSVLALLAGAALSTQAIDLQFHACGGVCWADQLLLLHSTPLHRPAPLVTHAGRRPRPCQCHAAGLIHASSIGALPSASCGCAGKRSGGRGGGEGEDEDEGQKSSKRLLWLACLQPTSQPGA